MNISFAGKRILVTGAGEGIGRAIAEKLVECNATVVAVDKSQILLDELTKNNDKIEAKVVDIAIWEETRRELRDIGDIDGLVNNAGVINLEPFLRVKPDSFDRVFKLNVKALFNVSQMVARKMVERKKGGAIVNLSSHAARVGFHDQAVLCASKGAVDALSRNMAIELGPYNVRVNCVNPTVVMTGLGKIAWGGTEGKAGSSGEPAMKAKVPLGRFGEIKEAVHAVVFLLSDMASFITGISLPIDGGFQATSKQ